MELSNVRVLAEGLAFPEGPVALDDGSVLLVEILGGCVTRVETDGRTSCVAHVGGRPNSAAVGPDGALYICNMGFEDSPPGIQRLDIPSGKVEYLYTDADGQAFGGPNDLVFDASGSFWFTDHTGNAVLYADVSGGSIARIIHDAPGANGIGLSPNGDTVYWSQTYTRQIMLRRLSKPGLVVESLPYTAPSFALRLFDPAVGAIDPDTLLIGFPGAIEPDSLAIDSSGAICVGTCTEGGIAMINADGGEWQHLTLPERLRDERLVTNVCFGGEGLRTAFITCSLTGRLISCDWPRPGLKLAFNL